MVTNHGPNAIYVFLGTTVTGASKHGIRVAPSGGVLSPLEVPANMALSAIADTAVQVTGAATILTEW